jgi:hypothetical protein
LKLRLNPNRGLGSMLAIDYEEIAESRMCEHLNYGWTAQPVLKPNCDLTRQQQLLGSIFHI